MPPVQRRIRPGNAVARGQSSQRLTEETGKGRVNTVAGDRQGTYYENNSEHTVLTQRFTSERPPAYVKASGGITINLTNYEFLRIDVSVSLPCLPDQLDEAFDEAANFVSEKISEEQTNWLGQEVMTQKGKGR